MSENYFEIISQSPYLLELNPVENIEDCTDEFLTKEELEEMGFSTYSWSWRSARLIESKAKATLNALIKKIPKGKKSIIIPDEELIEALKKTDTAVSELVKNTRRVGNRLFKYTKAEKIRDSVTYADWLNLLHLFEEYLQNNGAVIRITTSDCERVESIAVLKSLAPFEVMKETYEKAKQKWYKWTEQDFKWMKELYDNPSLAPLPKKK